ncbi:MAG: chemotaxis protein CheX [Planctomycetota bacterium]|jgi:CheY-specific phosphatase CheX
MTALKVDQTLLESVIQGTTVGLQMTGVAPPPVGASCFFDSRRTVSIMVGVVGQNNGSCTINMSEKAMLWLAGKLLFEEQDAVNEETIDAIMEVGNMVAGAIKEELVGTAFEAENISVPSMIWGAAYDVVYTRGMNTVTVEFELEEMPLSMLGDRFFTVSLSLMRRVA